MFWNQKNIEQGDQTETRLKGENKLKANRSLAKSIFKKWPMHKGMRQNFVSGRGYALDTDFLISAEILPICIRMFRILRIFFEVLKS
jgi:hypothetical protein